MSTVYQQPSADTLIGAALAPLDWTRSVSLVVAFSLLTALAAQIVIPLARCRSRLRMPFYLSAALLGSRLGAMAMIVHLTEGALGLPFFSGGTMGLPISGPTGGYLVAFPAAAFVTGAFAENGWDKTFSARQQRWLSARRLLFSPVGPGCHSLWDHR